MRRSRKQFIKSFVGTSSLKYYFMQLLIWEGKKLRAYRLADILFLKLKLATHFLHFNIFFYSIARLRPLIALKSVRVGSTFYKVPAPLTNHRRRMMAFQFLLRSAKDKKNSLSIYKIEQNLLSIFLGKKNAASAKKYFMYKTGLMNKSFIWKLRYASF